MFDRPREAACEKIVKLAVIVFEVKQHGADARKGACVAQPVGSTRGVRSTLFIAPETLGVGARTRRATARVPHQT